MRKRKHSDSSKKAVPRTTPAVQTEPGPTKLTGALIAAFVLMLFFLRVPREVMTTNLDPSWGAVLDYAHSKRLQFGTDIVFTYGPLGYLTIEWFAGHEPGLRMLFDLVFDFGIATGVSLLAWRTAIYWRVFLLVSFVLLTATVRPGMFDVPMEIGLVSWFLLCLVETRPRFKVFVAIFCAVAVIGSMAKFTFLLLDSLTAATLAADFVIRRKIRLAFGLIIGYVAGAVCLWILLGQNPLHFGDYLKTSLEMSAGYESAMGFQFKDAAWTAGVFTLCLAFAVGVIRVLAADEAITGRRWLRRGVFSCWLFCILFLAWKHGFLRAKSDLWAGFVTFVALSLEALPVPDKQRVAVWAARACAILCCVLALLLMFWKEPDHFKDFAGHEAARFGGNLQALLNPAGYARDMNSTLEAERDRAQLPRLRQAIGSATVDVFGQSQAYAVFNDLNYRPRPVFQSYCAFAPALMELNEREFATNTAPDFVLFKLEAIDARFPPLEDAPLLRRLLADYALVDAEGPFLLLKHQSSSASRMTLLRDGVARANEIISVAEYGESDLWLEISLTPSAKGRFREAFYKPSEVYLVVWGQSTTRAPEFRAPVPMLAAGFLASPVLAQTKDVADLYTGSAIQRPRGYMIRLQPGTESMWHELISYRLYRIDTKLGRNSTFDEAQLKLP